MSDSDDVYGPVLPPTRKPSSPAHRESIGPRLPPRQKPSSLSDRDSIGPQLPPTRKPSNPSDCESIGPRLPSRQKPSSSSDGESIRPELPPGKKSSSPGDNASVGSQLPPRQKLSSHVDNESMGPDIPGDSVSIGPRLPPGVTRRRESSDDEDEDQYGPALPPGFAPRRVPSPSSSDDDEGPIGPRPPCPHTQLSDSSAAADLERRAQQMKKKLHDASAEAVPTREEWMLELPEDRAGQFGLGARQFRRSAAPERDNRGWTETPTDAEQAKHGSSKKTVDENLASKRRDERIAAVADKLNTKRGSQSLLDKHQKQRKQKKAESSSEPKRRREFDRDRDLGTNKFDEAQKNAAIKRSRGASDMFSSGANKYL